MAVTGRTGATTRSGQLFIFGAILFGALIVGTILLTQSGGLQPPGPESPKTFFDWGMDEYPRTVNLAVAENSSARHLRHRATSFLGFQRDVMNRHGATMQAHTLVLVPNSTGATAVVGNFRGTDMDNVRVRVDGTQKRIGTVDDGETRLLGFTGLPETFNASLTFVADSGFDHDFRASRHRVTALYNLKVESAEQTWTGTEIY